MKFFVLSNIGYYKLQLNKVMLDFGFWSLIVLGFAFIAMGIYQLFKGRKRKKKKRKERLTNLEKTINQYRQLVENAHDIIYRMDLQGNFTYVNPIASTIMGYSEEEMLGKNYLELIHPDYRKAAENFYSNQFTSDLENTYFEFPAYTKTGKLIWFGQNVSILREQGKITGFQAVTRDISARKSAEEQLQINETLFRQFIKYTPAAVAMLDRQMNYLAVSDQWLVDFHIDDPEIIGKSHTEIYPEKPDDWNEMFESCLSGLSQRSDPELFVRADGSQEWLQWEIHPWYEVSNRVGGIMLFVEFITKRKEAEDELLRAKEFAEEASRAKSNFIANMSHELRTPLTSILGYAQMLELDSELSQGQLNQINQIKESGEQLLTLINDILELSDIETRKIEFEGAELNPRQMIKEIVRVHSGKFSEKDNRVFIDLNNNLPASLYSDVEKIEIILNNLVDNAFKFTKNGKITIRAELRPVQQGGANGIFIVTVADTGSGISSDKLKSIFKPFTKIDEQYNRGTGLGLTMVQRLCRFLGGILEVESEEEQGSSFTIKIPVQVQHQHAHSLDKEMHAVTITKTDPTGITTKQVSDFIKSLDKKNRNIIFRALEMQDLETIAQIDQKINLPPGQDYNILNKLKSSAENYDYLFITNVNKELTGA